MSTDTLTLGDRVTIGKGRAVHTITAFGTRANGAPYAVLTTPGALCDQTVNLDRLNSVGDDPEYRDAVNTEAQDRRAFKVGDRVRIGRGKTEWVIDRFWGDNDERASLEPVVGYSGTSVLVSRLRAVQ